MQEDSKVAWWMMSNGYATGHGDTTEDMLAELEAQAMRRALDAARKIAEEARTSPPDKLPWLVAFDIAAAIEVLARKPPLSGGQCD